MKIAGINIWNPTALERSQHFKDNAHLYDKFVVYAQMECEVWNAKGFSNLLDAAQSQNKKLIAISGVSKFLIPVPFQDQVIYELNEGGYYFFHAFNGLYGNQEVIQSWLTGYNNTEFKYPFITLNRVAWPHRCEMIDLVYKNNLFEKNCIGWLKPNPLMPYTWKYWTPKVLSLDEGYYAHQNAAYRKPKIYFDCFAELVSESSEKAIWLTEKTTTPLYLKKPFLVAGVPGHHKFLTELGFKLYDEIFDYSFDSIIDRTERYDTMLQNFVKLNKLPLKELTNLYKKISDKLEFNRQRAIEIGKNKLYLTPTLYETIDLHNKFPGWIDNQIFDEVKNYFPVAEENYKKIHNV